MITVSMILTILAMIVVLVILFKLFRLAMAALKISSPWAEIGFWVLVLIVVVWAFGFLGIMQPIIR